MDEKSVEMYELHVGYRITTRDIVAIKAATWKLFEPMGIPWGPHKIQDEEAYPGRLREYGVGVCYQRMLWKGAFAAVEVMPMKKVFLDESDKQLDTGFKLYTSYHWAINGICAERDSFLNPRSISTIGRSIRRGPHSSRRWRIGGTTTSCGNPTSTSVTISCANEVLVTRPKPPNTG
ncbi:MAG: hypothetical protein IPO90_08200 [Flavobacteriales bacterium]|nr:hypothetical protein [Flavobacteriales bacterium]